MNKDAKILAQQILGTVVSCLTQIKLNDNTFESRRLPVPRC